MKKTQEKMIAWRKKSPAELQKELREKQHALTKHRIGISFQKEKNTSLVDASRKDIARIATILHEEQS